MNKEQEEGLRYSAWLNLLIGFYNMYLYAQGDYWFNLLIGSLNIGVWVFLGIMERRRKEIKEIKKKTLQQMRDYLNDASLMIKRVSRDFFMDTDIGTRKHKDKTKYNRKQKYKKRYKDEL